MRVSAVNHGDGRHRRRWRSPPFLGLALAVMASALVLTAAGGDPDVTPGFNSSAPIINASSTNDATTAEAGNLTAPFDPSRSVSRTEAASASSSRPPATTASRSVSAAAGPPPGPLSSAGARATLRPRPRPSPRRRPPRRATSPAHCGDQAGPPCRGWTWPLCNSTAVNTDGASFSKWRPPASGDPKRLRLVLTPPGCDVDALTLPRALACLRDRHVLLLGDSLTRYQYFSLVQFLELGAWRVGQRGRSEVEHMYGWRGGFNGLFAGANARFRGREICDCFRGGKGSTVFENHYYHNAEANVRISYMWRPGVGPLTWHSARWVGLSCMRAAFATRRAAAAAAAAKGADALATKAASAPAAAACPQRGCKPGVCGGTSHSHVERDTFSGVLKAVKAIGPVDAIVFNVGAWSASYADPDVLHSLVDLGRQLREVNPRMELYWKTTTARPPSATEWVPQLIIPATLRASGWRVIDAGGVTMELRERARAGAPKDFFIDGSHLSSFAYRGLNELLLGDLCAAEHVW